MFSEGELTLMASAAFDSVARDRGGQDQWHDKEEKNLHNKLLMNGDKQSQICSPSDNKIQNFLEH